MRLSIAMLAFAVVLCAAPGFAQHGRPGGAMGNGSMGNGMGHGSMGANNGAAAGSTHGVTIDQQLKNNTTIAGKIATLTKQPAATACQGFKNLGQCVAAAHVSQNLGMKFDCLKLAMTGIKPTDGTQCTMPATSTSGKTTMSLGKAIQTLDPSVNASAEAKKAQKQANQDMKDSSSS